MNSKNEVPDKEIEKQIDLEIDREIDREREVEGDSLHHRRLVQKLLDAVLAGALRVGLDCHARCLPVLRQLPLKHLAEEAFTQLLVVQHLHVLPAKDELLLELVCRSESLIS